MDQRLLRVRTGYSAAYPPMRFVAGAHFDPEPHSETWPGWVFVRSRQGDRIWLPAEHLREDDTSLVLVTDFDATELSVEAGESVEVVERLHGWVRVRRRDGEVGWIPEDSLEDETGD